VLCALDAGNLAHVATGLKIWLELNNQKSIVIVAADNDASKPTNIGLTKARAACESTGFSLAYPTSNDSADFSDLHVTQGLSAVQACIDSVCNSHFRGLLIDGYTKQGEIKLLPQGKAALVIRDNCSLLLGYDSVSQEFRTYSSGQWSINTSLKDDLFSWVVEQTDGGAFSSSWFEGVMSLLRNTCGKNFHGAFSLNKHLIPFKNGVFNSKKKELLPHSPDFLLTYQLPHSYDPSASCPKFQKFLLQMVTHDSLVQVLRAYINAVIYSKVELQRYLELIGTGGTGKSTFCEVIIELVGINNHYSAGSLENFEKDKHEAGNTVLKKLIIFPDQSGYASNPSNLKRFIGGDYLVNRPLFKSGVPFKNESGLVIVTANQPIVTSDNSNGMKRRRITLRCDTPPAVRNYNLSLELCEEIPGIINWALSLLDSDVAYLLSDNNVATELRQQDLDNLLSTNPLARFFYENTEPCENSRIPIGIAKLRSLTKESLDDNGVIARATEREYKDSKTHLYPCYLDWDESRKGNNSGKKSIAHNRFSAESEEIIKHQLKWTGVYFERNSKGSFLCGIRFKPALSSQDNDVYAPAPEPYAPVYESENPAPMTVQTVPIAAPAPVVPHFYESILHGGDRQKMLKNWHNMTRRLNPVEKLELKRLSEKAYQQAFESEPNEVKRENAGCAAGTEYLRKWADSHGVVSQ
jgi:P4 family phage/plasmid primase-like protien